MCDLLNSTSDVSRGDNDCSDSSNGWVNTDQSDSDGGSVSGSEVEQFMVRGLTAAGKERATFSVYC